MGRWFTFPWARAGLVQSQVPGTLPSSPTWWQGSWILPVPVWDTGITSGGLTCYTTTPAPFTLIFINVYRLARVMPLNRALGKTKGKHFFFPSKCLCERIEGLIAWGREILLISHRGQKGDWLIYSQ